MRKTNTSCGNGDGDRGLRKGGTWEGADPGEFSSTTSQLHRIRVEYFIRRPSSDENEKDGVVQPAPPLLSFRSPPTPTLVRIINGQFAASAADCIVSLFSGPPSVGWQAVFPLSRILSRLPSVFRLSRRLHVEWFSLSFFLQSTFRPLHYPRRFILRAVRSSLRWHELREVSVTWNPFVCRTLFVVSLRGHFPLRLDRKTEIEMGKV